MRRLYAVIVTACASGCLFPAISDLVGTTDSGTPSDATTSDVASDVSMDVIAPSDVVVQDSGTDTSTASPFCSTVDASFCDDFDDTFVASFPKWTFVVVDDGGVVSRAVDAGTSTPNALGFVIGPSGSGSIRAYIANDFVGVSKFRLTYDWIIDTNDLTGSILNIGDIQISSSKLGIRLAITTGGAQLVGAVYPLDAGPTYPPLSSKVAVAASVWHHVDISVDLTTTPASVSYSLDGVSQTSDAGIPGATFGPGSLEMGAGAYYATSPTTGWSARIDNVAFWH